MKPLEQITKEAYYIFKKYKVKTIDVCINCCVSKKQEKELLSMSVKEISKDTIIAYTDSSHNLFSQEEILHFLPRYFDILANLQFTSLITEVNSLGVLLSDLDFKKCNIKEKRIMEDFAKSYFITYLHFNNQKLGELEISFYEILILLYNARLINNGASNIDFYLKLWEKSTHLNSILHYRDILYYGFGFSANFTDPFASKNLINQVKDWSISPRIKNHFKQRIEEIIITDNSTVSEITINELNLFYETL